MNDTFPLFFEEPVGALDGLIELAWVDVEVGNGVEVAVGDIHGTIGLLRDDGVAVDDEAVVEVGTYHVPAAWLAIGEQMAHAVVADGVGNAERIVHQCGDDVVVGGAVMELLRLCVGRFVEQRHANLPRREIAVVAPKVLFVFVELLCVVARNHDDGVVVEALLFELRKDFANHLVNLPAAITIEVEEGCGVGVVAESCVVGVIPRRRELLGQLFGVFKAVGEVVEQEGKERRLPLECRQLTDEVGGDAAVAVVGCGARCADLQVGNALEYRVGKGRIDERCAAMDAQLIAFGQQFIDENRADMARHKALPIVAGHAEEEAEDRGARAIAAAEMVVIPLTFGGEAIDMGHRFGRQRALVPRVDEEKNDVGALGILNLQRVKRIAKVRGTARVGRGRYGLFEAHAFEGTCCREWKIIGNERFRLGHRRLLEERTVDIKGVGHKRCQQQQACSCP